MNKLIFALTIVCAAICMVPAQALAQDCVTQYGGAVVCGAATPQFHPVKKTGIADMNLPLIGTLLLGASGVLYFKSKRTVAHS